MSYFTKNYRLVTTVSCLPFPLTVNHSALGSGKSHRWICKCYKESLGSHGVLITLIDNQLEIYSFIWRGPGTTELIDFNKITVTYSREEVPVSITCVSINPDQPALPDFAIDVMETVQINALYEVIRRIAVAFHEKMQLLQVGSKCG